MAYRFYTADVFTDRIFGGNQLAVLPDARGLSGEQMQRVAGEFNLAETSFVLPPETADGTRKLRIFTPAREMPFAGHPTVGTAHVLAAIGEIELTGNLTEIVFEEGVGPIPVTIASRDGMPTSATLSAAQMPETRPAPANAAEIADMLSLDPSDIRSDMPIAAVSCGVPFLYVPLAGLDAAARARVKVDRMEALMGESWAQAVYVVCLQAVLTQAKIHARMFAPAFGIAEDPATGAAATALAGYLAPLEQPDRANLHWVIEQGVEMGRPSIIDVRAKQQDGKVTEIRVGGSSVLVSNGEIEVPD